MVVYSDRELVWGGLAVAAWVLYQCITGKFAYKGRGFRRKDAPGVFWAAIAFETLFAIICILSGLNRIALATTVVVLLFLSACGFIGWGIQESQRIGRKYPHVFRLLKAGRQQEAARELEGYLAAHPDDRAAIWMLASAYKKVGDKPAATELYALLAQTDDHYGYEAQVFLRGQIWRQTSSVGKFLDVPLGDLVKSCVQSVRGRRRS